MSFDNDPRSDFDRELGPKHKREAAAETPPDLPPLPTSEPLPVPPPDADAGVYVQIPNTPPSGFKSSEFTATATGLAVSLISVLVVAGKLSPDEGEQWTKAITATIVSLAAFVMSSFLVWNYIRARLQVKQQAMRFQAQVMGLYHADRADRTGSNG